MSGSGKNKRRRGQPELSVRVGGFRLELERLPRFRRLVGWGLGLLAGAGAGAVVKVVLGLHLMR